jgi:hypothetical protein
MEWSMNQTKPKTRMRETARKNRKVATKEATASIGLPVSLQYTPLPAPA